MRLKFLTVILFAFQYFPPGTWFASEGTVNVSQLGFDWYVDSVHGSDSNSGKAPWQAFQTISAVSPKLVNGVKIGLARGSSWREQLSDDTKNNVTVAAYGYGDRPLLDASDVIASGGWSKTGGATSVYQVTLSGRGSGSFTKIVWEDNVEMTPVASVAACDALARSYYSPSTSGATVTVYVHATGDGNPASNGKTYEHNARDFGVNLGNSATITSIAGRRPLNNNGAIRVLDDGYVKDTVSTSGATHAYYGEEGTVWDGAQAYDAWSSMFVCYESDTSGTKNCTFLNSTATATTATAKATSVGFYGHTGGSTYWPVVIWDGCTTVDVNAGFAVNEALSIQMIDSQVTGTGTGKGLQTGKATTVLVSGSTLRGSARQIDMSDASSVALTVTNSTLVGTATDGSIYSNKNGVSIHITGSTWQNGWTLTGASSSVYSMNNTFTGGSGKYVYYMTSSTTPGTFASDYNAFGVADCKFRIFGTDYATLALYRAGTGQDAHSTPAP